MAEANGVKTIECGKEAAEEFDFADGYRCSFGTYPATLKRLIRRYQDEAEAFPDKFIRYEYPRLLDEARESVAQYLHAPIEACVFVPNATTGFNTVLRNLVYDKGDVIIYFATIYGACEKTIDLMTETTPVKSHKLQCSYPVSDDELCALFKSTIAELKSQGKNPKVAVYDTIASVPGVRMPFERLTELCKMHDIISLIDGAHGAGHIPLDLSKLDPDFFFSNCHKWLYTPRGCALFYVPVRNQHLIRSTLPTSHGFIPKPVEGKVINNPFPASTKSPYITNFEFVGTVDNTPYLCVPAAIEWRSTFTYDGKRGEDAIFAYNQQLARRGGEIVSKALDTEVMENEEGTLGKCNFANVRLPLPLGEIAGVDPVKAAKVARWIERTLVDEHDTFMMTMAYAGAWWVRLSSQVYLTEEDFEWAGGVLKALCEPVKAGEWEQ